MAAEFTGNSGGNLDFFGGSSALNSLPASTTATISSVPLSPLRQGSTTFTVAAGTTSNGVDLDISSVLRTSPSGDAIGAMFTKAGSGTLRLNAVNTYARPTSVTGGTVLVNGSLAAGSTVTVAAGATLGGTGIINGSTSIQYGGALAPGNNGIGKLTFNNTLTLSGNTLMEISKNGGEPTNDMAFVSTTLTLGGSLTATNIGTNVLAAGDTFKLFSAASFLGAFTNVALPLLPIGLTWSTNNLVVNGTIAVSNLTYTLSYLAGSNGTINGITTQTLVYGSNGTPINAVANSGYYFTNWSDGSVSNPRTDTAVISNLTVTANFAPNPVVAPVIDLGSMALTAGGFTLGGLGGAGQRYVLLSAPDLVSPVWTPIDTNFAGTNGVFSFTDPSAGSKEQRFYRICSP